MTLLAALKQSSAKLSAASKFTSACGLLYLASGVLFLLWLFVVQQLLLDPDFVGNEATWVRILGMTVAVIGMFYFAGGRSGGKQIVAASIVDRIFLVPFVLVPAAASGVFPYTLLLFAVLAPALAVVAWCLLSRKSAKIARSQAQGVAKVSPGPQANLQVRPKPSYKPTCLRHAASVKR